MEPAPEAIFMGKVASGVFRWKTTVLASGVSTFSSAENITEGPFLSLMRCVRSKENLTSFEVSASPLLKVRPGLRVQR